MITSPQGYGGRKNHPQVRRLFDLMPKIRRMAKRELLSSFVSLRRAPNNGSWIELTTTHGTRRGQRKFELRTLLGWIELFDTVR
jgi:hypothetical protein